MTRHAITAAAVLTPAGAAGDAVVVENGKVVAVAHSSDLGDLPATHHDGATIVPAMIDSHLHPLGYAALVSGTSLKGAASVDDLVNRLAETDTDGAIIAQRFDDTTLGRMPTRHDLDRAWPDRPVLAYRYCGHIAVANTPALELAGIGAITPDPPGGSIDRDGSGNPSGVLRETAVEIVNSALDPLVAPPDPAAVLAAMDSLVATGLNRITGVVATTQALWCGVGDELGTLCQISADLPLDVDVLVVTDNVDDLRAAAAQVEAAGGRLRFWGWKAFADGSLGGHTAAMHAPFADIATTGTFRLDPHQASEMAWASLALGGVAAIHAIGDRAVDRTLDVFAALVASGAPPEKLRVEHASVVSDEAIMRLSDLGVVASVQPPFLLSESSWVPDRLGPDRRAYRFAAMETAGVRLIGGSDCPVEPPDPLQGIAAAVSRAGWGDGEGVDFGTALRWYTAAPAALLDIPAPLAVGSVADFVVVAGRPGTDAPAVGAVYQRGEPVELRPAAWPG